MSGGSVNEAAARLSRKVSRMDRKAVEALFPAAQRQQWPTGYLPASGVAHFLHPDGVPLLDIIDCHRELRQSRHGRAEIQRDFASDYTLWNRCVLEDFVRVLGRRRQRHLRQFAAKDRLVADGLVRELFQLLPYAPPRPAVPGKTTPKETTPPSGPSSSSSSSLKSPANDARKSDAKGSSKSDREEYYTFTPYAATQHFAMLPIESRLPPASSQAKVTLTTFPQIRNILETDFDSLAPLRAVCLYGGEDTILTREMVQALAQYVARRLAELQEREDAFLASAAAPSEGMRPTFSRDTPVLALFGNGRLAWALNSSGILGPATVFPVQTPGQAAQRERRQRHFLSSSVLREDAALREAFATVLPCETLSVGDALRKYRPAIVIVEPHVDRDWLSDIRGYYSVREVLCLGPVDSPAMASFAHPFLSFGVTPGPETYWVYNDNMQKVAASHRIQMPVDPPHEAQGYSRAFVDDVSAWLLSPNDTGAIGRQYRCLRFVRDVCPVVRSRPAASPSPDSTPTAPSSSSSSPLPFDNVPGEGTAKE